MTGVGTPADADGTGLFAGEAWFASIEAGVRERVRGFVKPGGSPDIQELLEQELTAALGRTRHERAGGEPAGYRNGTRERQWLGSFGPVELSAPPVSFADTTPWDRCAMARMAAPHGGTREWRRPSLPRSARMTRQVEALIAGAYLSGTNTRRVKRALAALFSGAVSVKLSGSPDKDVVSRTWRKVRTGWDAWNRRAQSRAGPPLRGAPCALRYASGACAAQPWRPAWRRPATGCSPSSACPPKPVALGTDHQRHRAPPREVQAPDQDADCAALGRDRRHTVLGVDGVRRGRTKLGDLRSPGARLTAGTPSPSRSPQPIPLISRRREPSSFR